MPRSATWSSVFRRRRQRRSVAIAAGVPPSRTWRKGLIGADSRGRASSSTEDGAIGVAHGDIEPAVEDEKQLVGALVDVPHVVALGTIVRS